MKNQEGTVMFHEWVDIKRREGNNHKKRIRSKDVKVGKRCLPRIPGNTERHAGCPTAVRMRFEIRISKAASPQQTSVL